MRIAAFNVENMFDRAKAMSLPDSEKAKSDAIIAAASALNVLLRRDVYDAPTKAAILAKMKELDILDDDEGPFVWLRKIRGKLVNRPTGGGTVTVEANGRSDWVGWVEHKRASVNQTAVLNTGRVIRDVNADVLAVMEAEDRIALSGFASQVLGLVGKEPGAQKIVYGNIMLIDGNDDRGIDVGLMTKADFAIHDMRSHISARDSKGNLLFARDCPEFLVKTPSGARLWVLPNHLSSKFGGDSPEKQRRRREQAKGVADLYRALIAAGESNVVVLGDLNDTPDSEPLAPLLQDTDLKDIDTHPAFDTGVFPQKGTHGLGNDNAKIDYLLLSPTLFQKVTGGGLFRKGAWPGVSPKRWPVYPELTKPLHAASDHHLIFADIAI
jgi:endonuclease/exonuclease/phosphatase family metal-dependent hydrolase